MLLFSTDWVRSFLSVVGTREFGVLSSFEGWWHGLIWAYLLTAEQLKPPRYSSLGALEAADFCSLHSRISKLVSSVANFHATAGTFKFSACKSREAWWKRNLLHHAVLLLVRHSIDRLIDWFIHAFFKSVATFWDLATNDLLEPWAIRTQTGKNA